MMDDVEDPLERMIKNQHERVEKAYETGLLHGMNAQAIADTKARVLEPSDLEWTVEE